MPYITAPRGPRIHQMTFDDVMNGLDPESFAVSKDTFDTVTWISKHITDKTKRKFDFGAMFSAIEEFNEKYADLIAVQDKSTLYKSFKIPKRNGKLRQIDAPKDELMAALRDLKSILEEKFFFTYHTSAFAYVRGRCTLDAVKRHQKNGSRWVLKTDLSKFFPNTTPEFLYKMIYQTFPLCEYIVDDIGYREAFEKAMSLCFLNGGLPQGTPTSPMLTNQIMIPIDYAISKICREHKPHLCYTRYADDMDISSEFSFHWTDVVADINKILLDFSAPFKFNKEKIHYGSTAGRNWMLGVMLNKDGNITIGHEKKKLFKTMLFSFGSSVMSGEPWGVDDCQLLRGLYSYYYMVEGDTIKQLVARYSSKFGFDIIDKLREIISKAGSCSQ